METSSDSSATSIENEESPTPVLGYSNQAPSPNVVIWCRLLAIGMLALGVERIVLLLPLVTAYMLRGRSNLMLDVLASGVVALAWPALAWYCWAQAPEMALRISSGSATTTGQEKTDVSGEILSIALLVLGMYEVMESLSFLASLLEIERNNFHNLGDLPWRDMTAPLLRLAIGLILIFRNHVATAYLRRVSRAPNPDVE